MMDFSIILMEFCNLSAIVFKCQYYICLIPMSVELVVGSFSGTVNKLNIGSVEMVPVFGYLPSDTSYIMNMLTSFCYN
jgi:hypothetical protein